MTQNQIAYKQAKEQERSNRAKEYNAEETLKEAKKTGKSQRFANYTKGINNLVNPLKGLGSLIASGNDPSWYNGVPEASKDVANISYITPMGSELECESGNRYVEPGILKYDYIPVLPHRNSQVDSNWYRSFQSVYMDIRRANSGARNYSIANIAQWILASQSLITLWMEALRAYSTITHYSVRNRYYGRALCEACGFDPEDMENHLPQYRAFLSIAAEKIKKSIPVPQTMPWFFRNIWLAANVFADNQDVEHAHLSVCVPQIYYRYGDVEVFSTAIDRPSLGYSYTTFTERFNSLLDSIIYSQDAGDISGDILKAFPNVSEFAFPAVEEVPKLPIVWDELAVTQIRNASVVPMVHGTGFMNAFTITESETGTLTQSLKNPVTTASISSITEAILDYTPDILIAHKKDMKPEETLEINMLNCYYTFSMDNSVAHVSITDCATEVVTNIHMYTYTRETEEEPLSVVSHPVGINVIRMNDFASLQAATEAMLFMSRWYHGPIRTLSIYLDNTNKLISCNYVSFNSRGWVGILNKNIYQNLTGVAVASMLGLGAK